MASEDITAITILLSHSASVTATDNLGSTALHHASAWGNLKAVRALIMAGAPPLAANKANHTPLDYSVTKQAAQYFQGIVSDLDRPTPLFPSPDQQQLHQHALKLNTAVRAIATPPDEATSGGARVLGSPMSSPVRSQNTEPRQWQPQHQHQHNNDNTSPVKTNFGGLRLVTNTESAELEDLDDDPATAIRIGRSSIEEPRMIQ